MASCRDGPCVRRGVADTLLLVAMALRSADTGSFGGYLVAVLEIVVGKEGSASFGLVGGLLAAIRRMVGLIVGGLLVRGLEASPYAGTVDHTCGVARGVAFG